MPNFRYVLIPAGEVLTSPCAAVNHGVSLARAPFVGVMIDGARIASPGIVHLALLALQKFDRAVVATIGFHLGPAIQKWAALTGYDYHVEDELMKTLTGSPLGVGFNHLCCYARRLRDHTDLCPRF